MRVVGQFLSGWKYNRWIVIPSLILRIQHLWCGLLLVRCSSFKVTRTREGSLMLVYIMLEVSQASCFINVSVLGSKEWSDLNSWIEWFNLSICACLVVIAKRIFHASFFSIFGEATVLFNVFAYFYLTLKSYLFEHANCLL